MRTSRIISLFAVLIFVTVAVAFNSCSKKEEPPTHTVPILSTTNASDVTNSSAQVGGVITGNGGVSVTERGACFGTSSNPTISDNTTTSGSGTGTFECSLTGLDHSTKYYYKAYAINSVGVGYGDQKSLTTLDPPWQCGETITDPRDGQVYPTVQIGSQCWFQKNMNYEIGDSYCYDNDPDNCTTYGRLYRWDTFMNGDSSNNMVPSGAQGVCPSGWHVPSDAEWTLLIDYLGGASVAGDKMKSISSWFDNGNGTNSSGFTALPSGYRLPYGVFYYLTKGTHFWSSTEYSSTNAWGRNLNFNNDKVGRSYYTKAFSFSARCLQD